MLRILNFIFLFIFVFICNSIALSQSKDNGDNLNCDTLIKYYTVEIFKNPESSINYQKRAYCHYYNFQYDNAIVDLETAISIDDDIVDYYYDLAIVYLQKSERNNNEITSAKNALIYFNKVKAIDLNFYKKHYINRISELESQFPEITGINENEKEYECIREDLCWFKLKNSKVLYIKFPELLSSAHFNIIMQKPNKSGPGSNTFLLTRVTKQKFLDSFVSCFDKVQKERELFIMTIDDHEKTGVQNDLKYGNDINTTQELSQYSVWFKDKGQIDVKGLLELSDDSAENLIEHDGKLRLRVLKDSKPIKLMGYFVARAKDKMQDEFDEGVEEIIIEIKNYGMTTLNVLPDFPFASRWLLDRAEPIILDDYFLEINGKVFPNNMKYVELTPDGKSANFIVLLKRVTK